MNQLAPIEVFPPGEFLRDELEARDWSQVEFAEIIGRPARVVNEIIAGKRGISPETAKELAAALGTTAQFWMNLETNYQLFKTAAPSERIAAEAKLRERFPVKALIRRGWIEGSENFEVLQNQVLGFYGINKLTDEIVFAHAAKRNYRHEFSSNQLAWLFRVKNLAEGMPVAPYSPERLVSAIAEIEQYMTEPEEVRHVPRVLANAGIRFVVVEPFSGSKIDGACFWLDGRKPVVGMTLRLDRIDNFWFVLRHELEHLLQGDGKDAPILDELDDLEGELPESELIANKAAQEFCVPQEGLEDFILRKNPMFSEKSIVGYSRMIERHPGIVLGQLQKKLNRYDLLRKLLVKVRHHVVSTAVTDGYGEAVITE